MLNLKLREGCFHSEPIIFLTLRLLFAWQVPLTYPMDSLMLGLFRGLI